MDTSQREGFCHGQRDAEPRGNREPHRDHSRQSPPIGRAGRRSVGRLECDLAARRIANYEAELEQLKQQRETLTRAKR